MPGQITISIDKVVGETIKAENTVYGYSFYRNGTKVATFSPGEVIGEVWSWVYGKDSNGYNDGSLWFMLYTDNDVNKAPFFIKYDQASLSLANQDEILAQQKRDQLQKDIEAAGGMLNYVALHYGGWIAGGVVLYFVLAGIAKNKKQ